MQKRGLKMIAAVALTAICLFGMAGVAQASSWSDLPDSLLYQYGVTEDQVAEISQGFGSGLWLPNKIITRAQFVRMATVAFDIPEATPQVPTYSDVPETSEYFSQIEGATAAGLVNGVGGGRFLPNASIIRQQAAAIIARELAAANGYDLDNLYANTAVSILAKFKDGSAVARSLQSAVAFAIDHGIMQGSQDVWLSPKASLTRLQAAALLIRARAPQITAVSPASGSAAGGNKVTITGVGFAGLWEIGSVKFGMANAVSYTVDSATQITAVVPAGTAGTSVEVSVSGRGGSFTAVYAQRYSYTYTTPMVSSVSPGSGPVTGGNVVTINGSLLDGVTQVYFGFTAATTFTIVSSSQITAVAPPGEQGETVYVTVKGPAGTSSASADGRYTYGAPVVSSIDPAGGPASGGNTVVITGIGLFGVSDVLFGSKSAAGLTLNSSTQITVVAPPGNDGTTVDITVVSPGGTSAAVAASRYAYGAPLVTSVSPGAGPSEGYNSVIIRGTGFTGLSGASAVRFGARNAVSYEVVSDTKIIAEAPPGTAGSSVSVTVTNPAGTSPATVQYLYYGG
jgi:hypothetical protein